MLCVYIYIYKLLIQPIAGQFCLYCHCCMLSDRRSSVKHIELQTNVAADEISFFRLLKFQFEQSMFIEWATAPFIKMEIILDLQT